MRTIYNPWVTWVSFLRVLAMNWTWWCWTLRYNDTPTVLVSLWCSGVFCAALTICITVYNVRRHYESAREQGLGSLGGTKEMEQLMFGMGGTTWNWMNFRERASMAPVAFARSTTMSWAEKNRLDWCVRTSPAPPWSGWKIGFWPRGCHVFAQTFHVFFGDIIRDIKSEMNLQVVAGWPSHDSEASWDAALLWCAGRSNHAAPVGPCRGRRYSSCSDVSARSNSAAGWNSGNSPKAKERKRKLNKYNCIHPFINPFIHPFRKRNNDFEDVDATSTLTLVSDLLDHIKWHLGYYLWSECASALAPATCEPLVQRASSEPEFKSLSTCPAHTVCHNLWVQNRKFTERLRDSPNLTSFNRVKFNIV